LALGPTRVLILLKPPGSNIAKIRPKVRQASHERQFKLWRQMRRAVALFFTKNVYEPAMLLWGALDFASQNWPYARTCSLTDQHYFEHAC